MAGHVSPEAALGGPIAAVKDGDTVVFDIAKRRVVMRVSSAEIKRRLKKIKKHPEHPFCTGVMAKYARQVSSASKGAVTT